MGEILDAFLKAFGTEEPTKRCSKCWRYLSLSAFDHDDRTSDHLTYRCRGCNHVQDTANTFIPTHLTDPDAIHP